MAGLLGAFLGRRGIGAGDKPWYELSRVHALQIATDLQQGPSVGPNLRPEAEARGAAESFLRSFDADARFFSTMCYADDLQDRTCVGTSLLGTSLESGFLVVESTHVGCLLVGDED